MNTIIFAFSSYNKFQILTEKINIEVLLVAHQLNPKIDWPKRFRLPNCVLFTLSSIIYHLSSGGQRKMKHNCKKMYNCKTAIYNWENKSIAISLAHLLFHQHNCKILRRNNKDKWQNCKCNVTTANAMSQLQFKWHNCKNKNSHCK